MADGSQSGAKLPPASPSSPPLEASQRARASMEILGGVLKYSSGVMREVARENFRTSDEGKKLEAEKDVAADTDKMHDWVLRSKALAWKDNFYRLERFYQRYV